MNQLPPKLGVPPVTGPDPIASRTQAALPSCFSPGCFQYNQSMTQIEVRKLTDHPETAFEVTVRSDTVTKHKVTLTQTYYEKLTAGAISPEALVEESFAFLLAREPNTSILSTFNLTVISRYFPEYEREINSKFK